MEGKYCFPDRGSLKGKSMLVEQIDDFFTFLAPLIFEWLIYLSKTEEDESQLNHTKILLWLWNDCYRLITELNEASLNFETSWMTGDGELGSRRGASGLSYLKAPTFKKEALKHGLDWTREAAFTALNNQKLRREKHTNTPYVIVADCVLTYT